MKSKARKFQKFGFCKYKEHCMKKDLVKNVNTVPSAQTKKTVTRDTLKPEKEKVQGPVDLRDTLH